MNRFQVSNLFKQIQPLKQDSPEPKPKRQRNRGKKKEEKPALSPKPVTVPKPKANGKKQKKKIPVALREQVWLKQMGRVFEGKCSTTWCQNTISVFDFQSGHNIPESKGGPTNLENLVPLCGRCNLSMGNEYTFDQWCKISDQPIQTVQEVEAPKSWCSFLCLK